MIYKINTKIIDNYEYITDCYLILDKEAKNFDKNHLLNAPLSGDIISKTGEYQFILLDGQAIKHGQPKSIKQIKKEYKKRKIININKKYTINDELALVNKVLEGLLYNNLTLETKQEYEIYRNYINSLKHIKEK